MSAMRLSSATDSEQSWKSSPKELKPRLRTKALRRSSMRFEYMMAAPATLSEKTLSPKTFPSEDM